MDIPSDLNIAVIDPRDEPQWDEFVYQHREGTIFHTTSWTNVLADTFNYQPFYLVVREGDAIQAGLPLMRVKSWLTGNRLVSLPRTSYCDPLIQNGSGYHALIKMVDDLVPALHCRYAELKTLHHPELLEGTSGRRYSFFINQTISLERDLSDIWRAFHRSCVRQRIQRAEDTGVQVRRGETEDDLKLFHQLHRKTTQKHMIPWRPFVFFQNIQKQLFNDERALLFIAEVQDQPAAAAIAFAFKRNFIYEFLGLDDELLHYSAAHLLLWKSLCWAHEHGYRSFDFGLTPRENQGLAKYKRRWGAEEQDVHYFYFPDLQGYKKAVLDDSVQNNGRSVFLQNIKRVLVSRLSRHFG